MFIEERWVEGTESLRPFLPLSARIQQFRNEYAGDWWWFAILNDSWFNERLGVTGFRTETSGIKRLRVETLTR